MASTKFSVSDALAVKLWAKKLAAEALKATKIRPLIGTSSSSIIHRKMETSKGAGDQVTFGLRMQLSGAGRTEGETLEGHEEALTTYSDSLLINELRWGVRVRSENSIDQQRVTFDMRKEAKAGLVDWFAGRYSEAFFNQVCGYTVQSDTRYTGQNAVSAPASGRHIWKGTTKTDEGQGTSDLFTIDLIDKAKEAAITADPPVRPIMIGGEEKYVIYLDPYQVTDLRTSTDTGQWLDIQKAAMQGGKISKNPIYTGSLGEYNGVVIRMSHDVTQGVNSTTGVAESNVRRAVFLGAQSAAYAVGNRGRVAGFEWIEEKFDYKKEIGITGDSMWGMKKCQFNSTDFGTIVVSTYAVAHT